MHLGWAKGYVPYSPPSPLKEFHKGDLHVPVYFLAMLVVKLGCPSPPGVSGNASAQLTGKGWGGAGGGGI